MKLTDILHATLDRLRLFQYVSALTGGTSVTSSVVITAGGANYTSAPTVGFTGGGGTGAAGTAIIAGGQVIAVQMTNVGSGYTSAPTVSFTGGAGSGAAGTAMLLPATLNQIATLTLNPPFWGAFVNGTTLSYYTLVAGTDAQSLPTVVRPLDFNSGTNAKVWKLAQVSYTGHVYIGSVDNPNGVVTPIDPTVGNWYYKDQTTPVKVWAWSVGSTNWFPIMT